MRRLTRNAALAASDPRGTVPVVVLLAGLLWASSLVAGQESRAGHVEVGEDRLYYEELGSGAAILLLHDGLLHSAGMESQMQALSRAYRVLRYDRRGYGRSDTPSQRYSPSADLQAVLDAAGVGRAVLIGASAGGALAVDFALDQPSRVAGLVLVGPIVGGYGFSEHFQRRGDRAMAPAQEGDYARAMRNMVDDRFELAPGNDEARERLWELIEPLAEKHLTNPPELRILPEWSAAERLPELQVPTLIVVGEADIPDVHAHAGVLEAGIAGSERVVLEGAGHLVFFERPEELNRLVLTFLERVEW
jgi:pimeloyl-ACP methyl ester carboxylesterase